MTDGAGGASPFKVVELADVVDREIERVLNRWTDEGYRFESIHFVTQPGSRRPSMAFLVFRRGAGPAEADAPGGVGERPPRGGQGG
ncbi:MAG: DUF4177 domain-containing protein [Gemmatimonadota bacterium]